MEKKKELTSSGIKLSVTGISDAMIGRAGLDALVQEHGARLNEKASVDKLALAFTSNGKGSWQLYATAYTTRGSRLDSRRVEGTDFARMTRQALLELNGKSSRITTDYPPSSIPADGLNVVLPPVAGEAEGVKTVDDAKSVQPPRKLTPEDKTLLVRALKDAAKDEKNEKTVDQGIKRMRDEDKAAQKQAAPIPQEAPRKPGRKDPSIIKDEVDPVGDTKEEIVKEILDERRLDDRSGRGDHGMQGLVDEGIRSKRRPLDEIGSGVVE